MLVKCSARYGARSGDWLCAVSPSLTRNAPSAASTKVNTTEAIAAPRARWPRGVREKVQKRSATTEKNESPLVMRCVNSIIVSMRAECWITVPLHSGQ